MFSLSPRGFTISTLCFSPYELCRLPLPFLPCGFQAKPPSLVCVLLASITEALTVFFFPASHASHASAYYYSLSCLVLPLLQPETHCLYLPISSLKISPSLPAAHCFCFPFIFPETSLLSVFFSFMMQKHWEAVCTAASIHTRRITFFSEAVYSVLVTNWWENKTKQRKTRLSAHWSLFSELLYKIAVWGSGKSPEVLHSSVPIVKVQLLFNKEIHFHSLPIKKIGGHLSGASENGDLRMARSMFF